MGLKVPHGDPPYSDRQCVLMLSLDILGQYVTKICEGVKCPPRHLVQDSTRIDSPKPSQPEEQ